MLETTLMIASPLLVNYLTQITKKFQTIQFSDNRIAIIRIIAVIFSFIAVVLTQTLAGQEVDPQDIMNVVDSILVFFGSQITYYLYKKGKMVV